jgi:ABC-type transporter Mla subunit MlaD
MSWRNWFDIFSALERIEDKIDTILAKEKIMSQELDNLAQQVQRTTDLEQGAVTLIKGLADQIAASKGDPAKLQQLSDNLKARADVLADSLAANTPAGGGTTPPGAAPRAGTAQAGAAQHPKGKP